MAEFLQADDEGYADKATPVGIPRIVYVRLVRRTANGRLFWILLICGIPDHLIRKGREHMDMRMGVGIGTNHCLLGSLNCPPITFSMIVIACLTSSPWFRANKPSAY